MKQFFLLVTILFALYMPLQALAFNYHVGPEQPNTTIGEVPWESLNAGDSVYIYWRSGTQLEPILVSGIAGPNGELPVINGEDATTRQNLDYTNESRGLIKIGSSNLALVYCYRKPGTALGKTGLCLYR